MRNNVFLKEPSEKSGAGLRLVRKTKLPASLFEKQGA